MSDAAFKTQHTRLTPRPSCGIGSKNMAKANVSSPSANTTRCAPNSLAAPSATLAMYRL